MQANSLVCEISCRVSAGDILKSSAKGVHAFSAGSSPGPLGSLSRALPGEAGAGRMCGPRRVLRASLFSGCLSSNFGEHIVQVRSREVTSVGNDARNLLRVADIVKRIRIEQDHVVQLSFLYGA